MAIFTKPPSKNSPWWSSKALKRSMLKAPLYDFLKRFATQDVVYHKYDFWETLAIGDLPFAVANSGGTSAADFAIKADTENGVIEGDTGTTDNGSVSIIGKHVLKGDRNAGIEFRFKVDDVSEANIEFGLIDAVPGSNASGVNDEDTPTMTAADAALFSWDTDETYTGVGTYTVGSTAGQGAARTSVVAFASLTDATYYRARIQLIGNSAFFFWNDDLVASHDTDPQGNLEGGVALYPWFYARTRNTTAKFPQIDVIEVWHDRN